ALPKARHSATATGCALTRSAMRAWAPVSHAGVSSDGGSNHVCGPGQVAQARCQGAPVSATNGSSASGRAATRLRPLSPALLFAARRRSTASALNGSQARPQTPSVGSATSPPARRMPAARRWVKRGIRGVAANGAVQSVGGLAAELLLEVGILVTNLVGLSLAFRNQSLCQIGIGHTQDLGGEKAGILGPRLADGHGGKIGRASC